MEPRGVAGWPAKRAELRRRLATQRPRLNHTGPLRLAPGAVIGHDALAPALEARRIFLWIASEATPGLLVDLAGAPLDEFGDFWSTGGGELDADPPWPEATAKRLGLHFVKELFAGQGPTMDWVRRWGLPLRFDPPDEADERAQVRYVAAQCWGVGAAIYTLALWRACPLPAEGVIPLSDPCVLSDSFDAVLDLHAVLTLPQLCWDPLTETRAAAQTRLLGQLRQVVREELLRIEARSAALAAPVPTLRTGLEHLTWLARYQFGGESFAEIAHSAGCTRQSVAEAVKAASELVALPLRAPLPAGRPKARPTPPRIVRLGRRR